MLDKLDYDERVYEESTWQCLCECHEPSDEDEFDPDDCECLCDWEPDYEAIMEDRDAYDQRFDPAYRD